MRSCNSVLWERNHKFKSSLGNFVAYENLYRSKILKNRWKMSLSVKALGSIPSIGKEKMLHCTP